MGGDYDRWLDAPYESACDRAEVVEAYLDAHREELIDELFMERDADEPGCWTREMVAKDEDELWRMAEECVEALRDDS